MLKDNSVVVPLLFTNPKIKRPKSVISCETGLPTGQLPEVSKSLGCKNASIFF